VTSLATPDLPDLLDLPGRRIAYRVGGLEGDESAPVLVLGSSVGSTSTMWEPQVAALSRTFRVVRYDHRGHGASRPATPPGSITDLGSDVVALLDHLGVARASLGGLSLGGMLALVCTAAMLGPRELWLQRAAAVREDGMASIADAVLARWFTPGWPAQHPDVVARLRSEFEAVDPDAYAACCEAIADMDLREDLRAVRAPTLVLAGEDDPATPPALAEEIASRVPGARLAVVPEAAHLGSVEQPAAFTALLLGHLTGALDGTVRAPAGSPSHGEGSPSHGEGSPSHGEGSPSHGEGPSYDEGMSVRRAVLGDAHVDRALAQRTPMTADFQEFITRFAWGGVWTRPGLDRRTRSAITLAMLVALGQEHELAMHLRAALRNGLTSAEITEVLLQTTVYCGAPAANRAFAVAGEVLEGEAGGARTGAAAVAGDPVGGDPTGGEPVGGDTVG
jgi:3-oxoadipate enol-lactonase/4-carboxymuconolactone decarboxylase